MAVINKVDEKTDQPANLSRIPKKVLDREAFMQLFITQLQYQDPMKPIENHEMALQLAAFNQVDQLMNLNDKLSQMVELYKTNEFTLFANLVGKNVKIEGNTVRIENGKFLGAEFELSEPANKVLVTIKDSQGKVVKTMTLYNLPKGGNTLSWDGTDDNGNPLPDGNYKISITVGEGKEAQSITPLVVAKVTGAVLGDSPLLKINDSETIKLEQIREILGR
ncbi:MAG: FlgD immunoglobulin-like domain containing protein [Caldimicrobium sp.]